MEKPAAKIPFVSEQNVETMQSEMDVLRMRNADLEAQLSDLKIQLHYSSSPFDTLSDNSQPDFAESEYQLDTLPIPVLVTAFPQGTILYVNKQLIILAEQKKEDIIGRNAQEFYLDAAERKANTQTLDTQGKFIQKTVKFKRRNGEQVDTILSSQLVTFRGQEAAVSTVIDNTELVSMFQNLQENEERFRLLVENAPEAILLFDVDCRDCIEANRSALDLLGFTVSYLRESQADDLYPRHQSGNISSIQLIQKYVRQAFSGRISEFEWLFRSRSGKMLQCEVKLIAYELSGKKYIQCSIVEVGKKRKQEAVVIRNQRLQVLGRLTGGIAHDFNNILAIIHGHAELLSESLSGTSKNTDRLIHKIMNASNRGAELTQKLLAYSRNQPLVPVAIPTNTKMIEISDILASQIGADVRVALKLADNIWDCLADSSRLESAIINLCLNARDSMPEGGTLTLETKNFNLDDEYVTAQLDLVAGEYVQISISDTGGGISSEDIEHVFDPFFTTQDFGQKTGMGLSMVFGFIKQSSGHVSIYSEVGHGTVARIYLPRYVSKNQKSNSGEPITLLPAMRTVLLVEDDPDIRLLTLNLLQTMHYTVLEAKNAETALQLLQQNPRINLLITDFILEDSMNGEALAKEARRISTGLPVLIMTGYTPEIMSSHIEINESTVIMQKPFSIADLADKILEAKTRAYQASVKKQK